MDELQVASKIEKLNKAVSYLAYSLGALEAHFGLHTNEISREEMDFEYYPDKIQDILEEEE